MRHDDGGGADAALDLAQLDLHFLAQLGVEVGQRLVEQQDRGWMASARASATRCCWPPDMLPGKRSAKVAEADQRQRFAPRAGRARPWRRPASPGRRRHSRRPSCAETARSSGTRCPGRAGPASTPSRSRPSSIIAPDVGSLKPAIICSVVVLPQPDGPSSETNSPSSTPSDRPSTAICRRTLAQPSRTRNVMVHGSLRSIIRAERSALHLAVPALGPFLALGVDRVPVGLRSPAWRARRPAPCAAPAC